MKNFTTFLAACFLLSFIISCQEDSASSDNLNVDENVIKQAAYGFELSEIVSTSQEITEMTGETDILEGEDIDMNIFPGVVALKNNAKELMVYAAKKYKMSYNTFSVNGGDSIVFFNDDTTFGTRIYFAYNSESGIMRLYSVKYDKFFAWQVKTYDSTEIKVDYNSTLEDDTDDRLISIENLINYKESFFVQSVTSQILVTDYEDTEPTGLTLTRDSYYKESWSLEHLSQSVEINPDGSGTLREDFTFADGSTAYNSITFFDNETGEFIKQLRNGTTVSGQFNSAQEDGIGSWTEIIDLPAGRYIDQISRYAQVSLVNEIFTASFQQHILFSSGRIDSSSISIQSEEENGVTTTIIIAEKANGAHGTLTINEDEDSKEMVGEWTTWNGYFIESEAEWYKDESSHLIYRVYAAPYQAGDTPIIVAEYFFSPDGSADGTLLHDGITYLIKLRDNLKGEISYDGKKTEFNLIQ